jgi:hypothetical protein
MPNPNEESVIESGSQTGDGVQPQSSGTEDGEQGLEGASGEGKRENAIPHSRVEQMIASRLERERQAWLDKEVTPLRKQIEEQNSRLTQGQLAFLEKMGWYKPEGPKPLTREEFEEKIKAQEEKFQQAQIQSYHAQRINEGWRQVSGKYPQLAKIKYFQNAVLAEYAENPNRDFAEIGEEAAQQLLAHQSAVRQEERDERMAPHRRVVPSGRGAGGGSEGGKGKKLSVSEKIRAKLSERE